MTTSKKNNKKPKDSLSDKTNFEWTNLDDGIKIKLLEKNFTELKPITLLEDGTRFILSYLPSEVFYGSKRRIKNSAFFAIKHPNGKKEIIPLHELNTNYSCDVFSTWKDSRWDVKDVKDWLNSTENQDPKKLYDLINETTHSYFDYRNEDDYAFFNLWNIGTYAYQMFDSYPYIDYTGTKRAGKSKNQNFNTIVCYNGISTSDISSSALFRLIAGIGATVSIDEYENTSNSSRERNEQTRTLLNSGFMRDQFAIRNRENQGDFIPTQFDLYSPKNMAHIDGFDDVLEDRCVEMVILRSTNSSILNSWPDPNNDPRLIQIRHLCYRLFLDYGDEIKNLIEEARNGLKVTSRELKIWTPIMTLALFFEKHGVNGLTGSIQQKIQRSHEERDIADQQENLDILILKFARDYALRKTEENDGWILTQSVFGLFKDVAKECQINIKTISMIRFSKILKRLGFTPKRSAKGVHWLLDKTEIEKALVRMGLEEPTQATKPTQTTSEKNDDVDSVDNEGNEAKEDGDKT